MSDRLRRLESQISMIPADALPDAAAMVLDSWMGARGASSEAAGELIARMLRNQNLIAGDSAAYIALTKLSGRRQPAEFSSQKKPATQSSK